jgi:H+/gluconate symporter-like permease
MKTIQVLLILAMLLSVLSIAYIVYKIISKKLGKERKIAVILMQTEEGRNYLKEQENKHEKFAKRVLPIVYIMFFIILLISIGGTVFVVREYYEKGFENFTIEDLKLLVYPGLSIYFTLFLYRAIKNNRNKNTKNST